MMIDAPIHLQQVYRVKRQKAPTFRIENRPYQEKGKEKSGSSSGPTSLTLGKRSRTQMEEKKEASVVSIKDYNAGVRDAYEKISEELPGLRTKFRKEGWFMALKAANLDADKVSLGSGPPPFDRTPVFSDDSSASSDED